MGEAATVGATGDAARQHHQEVASDVDAGFIAFYEAQYGRLVASLRMSAPGRLDIEDVAQEAFARTLARWPSVRDGSSPTGYVYRVGFRLLFKRGPLLSWRGGAGIAYMPEDAVDVERAMAALPPRQRQVAVLCLYLEHTPAEAAAVLGMNDATVRVHLHRARLALIRSLGMEP